MGVSESTKVLKEAQVKMHQEKGIAEGVVYEGDSLILISPRGTNKPTTALEIAHLNNKTCKAMLKNGFRTCIDITDIGLLTHIGRVAEANDVSIEFDSNIVYGKPKGSKVGHKSFRVTKEPESAGTNTTNAFYDAQTPGWLMIGVPENKTEIILEQLREMGITKAAVIGRIIKASPKARIIIK
jgi:selenophosphate synthase